MVCSTTGVLAQAGLKANLTFPYEAIVFPMVESSWITAGTAQTAVITVTVNYKKL